MELGGFLVPSSERIMGTPILPVRHPFATHSSQLSPAQLGKICTEHRCSDAGTHDCGCRAQAQSIPKLPATKTEGFEWSQLKYIMNSMWFMKADASHAGDHGQERPCSRILFATTTTTRSVRSIHLCPRGPAWSLHPCSSLAKICR